MSKFFIACIIYIQSMSNWLDSSNNANCYKSMYVNGFIDISGGNIQTRNADNHLLIAGDSSFNSNLSLGKDLSIGIENPQYAVDISGTVDLKDNLLMRGDISLNKNLAAQNAGTLENHNYSEAFDDYDNLIIRTDQSAAVDTANDEFTTQSFLNYVQKTHIIYPGETGDAFGASVVISGDYAIIGAPFEGSNSINDPSNNTSAYSGAAYIFKTNDSGETWTQMAYLKPSTVVANARFGRAVAISGDYAIVGAYAHNSVINSEGAAYIFKRDSGAETWDQKAYLMAQSPSQSDYFGRSVAMDGDYVIIGAPWEDSNDITDQTINQTVGEDGYNSGAAYIFKKNSGAETWSQQAFLKADTPSETDYFGHSVSMSGDYVIVGAYGDGGSSADKYGAAYIFKRDSGAETWAQKDSLTASTPGAQDAFGTSVSINGDYAIIGAPSEESNSINVPANNGLPDSGAAYIFKRDSGAETWGQKAYLKASTPGESYEFGQSVSINGDYVVVGERKESTSGYTSGAAYIFKRDSGAETWSQQAFLKAPTPTAWTEFGTSMAITGDYAIIGDIRSVYTYKANTNYTLSASTTGANNMVLSDDGNRYAYIHGWTGATTQGAGTGGTLKVRSYNNGWSEDTVNDSGSLSVSTGNGSKNLYISGDGNVIVTAQVDSENYDSATDSTNGKIYMWIRNSSTNQWDRTIINIDNTLITGTPSAKNFNNWMTGGFGGVAVNYDGTRIAFSNAGVNDDNSGDASDLFVFGRSGTTLTYLGGVQTAGWGKICRCIFTKAGDKLFVGNYTDNDVKIYTIDSSSISLTKTITTSGHTTAGQLGINETGTKMVYLKDNTNFTVRTTSDNWANSTETTKTYPSSREFNHVGGASSNQKDFYGRWLDMSPNGNTMIVSTITGDNKRGRIGVYDISDLNSITEVKYLDAEAGTDNNDFKVGNNVVCKNTHYGFTANGESTGNWKSYNVFKSYDPTPSVNYYNQEFKGGNLFLNGNLTIDGTLSVGAVNATGNTITYDADTTMNKRLYVNNSDLSLDFITNGILDIRQITYNISEQRVDLTGADNFGFASEISADGNYMIIGEHSFNATSGRGYVYKRTDNNWTLYATLDPLNGIIAWMQGNGQYVSITHDGEFAVLAGTGGSNEVRPRLTIYKRNDTNSTYDLKKTIYYGTQNGINNKYKFIQIRKTDNGNILIFFWDLNTVKYIKSADNGENWDTSSGYGFSSNASGTYLRADSRATRLITADSGNSNTRIYDIDSSTGTCTISKTITLSSTGVAINEHGNTISIGDYAYSNNTGRIAVYKYITNDWIMQGSYLTGHSTISRYNCMAINPDGDKIAISTISDNGDDMMAIFKYMKVSQAEWNAANNNGTHTSESSVGQLSTTWKVLHDRGASWDENKYYWYQYSNTITSSSNYNQLSWAGSSYVLATYGNKVDLFEVNYDTVTINNGLVVNKVASNINTSGTFFADVSLNHNLVVPGNITIVDGSANNYGAYTTFTNKDATAYFNVGKSASNVFNIVDNNNIGVYMASDGNSMTSTSDERLKTDIESLDDPTEKLMQLKPCTYKWKTQEDDKKHVGFIAQEVEEVLPELVNETTYPDGASYKGVATSDLIPYLIKSIQERQLRINKLENK